MPEKAPAPVEVVNETLVVELAAAEKPTPVKTAEGKITLPPTTTEEGDRVTSGQRRTSMLWESVQATIAVSITMATIYCAIFEIDSETIVNAFFFIVATYFTRTNHTRIGGVGRKANEYEPYQGR